MALKLCALASGSKGNAIVIQSRTTSVLLDMGIPYRDFCARLAETGLQINTFDGLVISHTHSDHIKGAEVFCRKTGADVYAHAEAWEDLSQKLHIPASQQRCFESSFSVGDIGVHPFETPHDAPHSNGFCFTAGKSKISVVTDLGHMTKTIFSYIADSDVVLLESNYDEKMLATGFYPEFLKRRIAGERGHLSNRDASIVAAELAKRGVTRQIVLGHLSENNNLRELAFRCCTEQLEQNSIEEGRDIAVDVAAQYVPSRIYEVIK